MAMVPFHTRCSDIAAKETRSAWVGPGPAATRTREADGDLPPDEYAFLEFYCDDPECDCRRVFIQVLAKSRPGVTMASINFGWELKACYRKRMPYMPEAAVEITRASLDPLNAQSESAPRLLELFQMLVRDELYKARLARHYGQFRCLRKRK